jgi:hypothetical protein
MAKIGSNGPRSVPEMTDVLNDLPNQLSGSERLPLNWRKGNAAVGQHISYVDQPNCRTDHPVNRSPSRPSLFYQNAFQNFENL